MCWQFLSGICLIGNFDVTPPTAKQVAAVRALLNTLAKRYGIPRGRVLRHQDVTATLCPGRLFPWEQVLGFDSISPTPPSATQ
ncbi:MAG: peptidoglycan recognition family protein [Pirellulales bacterium]